MSDYLIEYLLVAAFALNALALYIMYRYFYDLYCEVMQRVNYDEENGRFGLQCVREAIEKRIDLLEQTTKDADQANKICCKSMKVQIDKQLEEYRDACTERYSSLCAKKFYRDFSEEVIKPMPIASIPPVALGGAGLTIKGMDDVRVDPTPEQIDANKLKSKD